MFHDKTNKQGIPIQFSIQTQWSEEYFGVFHVIDTKRAIRSLMLSRVVILQSAIFSLPIPQVIIQNTGTEIMSGKMSYELPDYENTNDATTLIIAWRSRTLAQALMRFVG